MAYEIRDIAMRLFAAVCLTVMLLSHGTSFAHETEGDPAEQRVCTKRLVGPHHHPRSAREKTFCRTVQVKPDESTANKDEEATEEASSQIGEFVWEGHRSVG